MCQGGHKLSLYLNQLDQNAVRVNGADDPCGVGRSDRVAQELHAVRLQSLESIGHIFDKKREPAHPGRELIGTSGWRRGDVHQLDQCVARTQADVSEPARRQDRTHGHFVGNLKILASPNSS